MIMTQLPLLTFVSVAAAILGFGTLIYELFFKYRDEVGGRLSAEFGTKPSKSTEQTRLFKDLSKLARKSDDVTDAEVNSLERLIEQAGLTLSVRQLLTSCGVLAIVVALIGVIATRIWWVSVVGFVLAFPTPVILVAVQRERRLNLLRQQLPDAFEMMSRTIRAGQTITGAFQTVADDFEAPIADEFAWCAEQQNLGLPQEVALRDLAKRSGVTELQMLVVALLVQRQSGGSPVEMLNNLSGVVRKRIELQEKIKTLTAEGRMQAAVLLLLPPLLFAIISALNPEYVAKLWERPILLVAMLASELLGIAWIRRILRLEF